VVPSAHRFVHRVCGQYGRSGEEGHDQCDGGGDGVLGHDAYPRNRRRTDRQVTQPSSFWNSLMSTVTGS
jgi:hypothetical protein